MVLIIGLVDDFKGKNGAMQLEFIDSEDEWTKIQEIEDIRYFTYNEIKGQRIFQKQWEGRSVEVGRQGR